MIHTIPRRTAARLFFIIGLFLMFLGSAFLLAELAGISRASVFVSFLFVIVGVVLASLAIKLNMRAVYLFFAAFFLQLGFFLFLVALRILPLTISQSWPLVSVFSGVALIPAGWRYYGRLRTRYIIPAAAFVILGCVLMVFSFHMVPFSFSQFIIRWWPLLVVLAGLTLVLVSLGTKKGESSP